MMQESPDSITTDANETIENLNFERTVKIQARYGAIKFFHISCGYTIISDFGWARLGKEMDRER